MIAILIGFRLADDAMRIDPRSKEIPNTLHRYHSLNPLEDGIREQLSRVFGFSMSVYKAISSTDGLPYLLRRLEGVRISAEYTVGVVGMTNRTRLLLRSDSFILDSLCVCVCDAEIWRQLQHPNIVTLREAFQAKEWPGMTAVASAATNHLPMQHLTHTRAFICLRL
jgi:hypothetical protein